MAKSEFRKTVFQVTVLSDDPKLKVNEFNIKDIAYQITDGDCSGQVKCLSHEILGREAMAKEALKQGTSPDFFGIDL